MKIFVNSSFLGLQIPWFYYVIQIFLGAGYSNSLVGTFNDQLALVQVNLEILQPQSDSLT